METLARRSFLASLSLISAFIAFSAVAGRGEAASPSITGVQVQSVQSIEKMENGKKIQSAKFQLVVTGENLGDKPADVAVTLKAKLPASSVHPKVDAAKGSELDLSGEAPLNTQITAVEVRVKDVTVSSSAFQINIVPTPPAAKVETFQIKFEASVDKTFPNLHTVVVTKTGGQGSFDSRKNRMHVELSPPGATDLQIVDANEQQMELHYVALPDYQPSKVLVTVYDGSDLDTRQAIAVAQPAPNTPAADPNAPSISRVDVVFLNRSQGNGRVRIYGSGFGQGFDPAPYPVDDFLFYCLQRENISSSKAHPPRQVFRIRGCYRLMNPDPNTNTNTSTSTDTKPALVPLRSRVLNGDGHAFVDPQSKWPAWREAVRKRITVTLSPRNTDLRIERVEVIDVNDSYIDVYFEFSRYPEYSLPFRLGGVTVVAQKTLQQTTSSKTAEGATVNVVASTTKSYQKYQDVGRAPNPDLTYRYTVLSKDYVNTLLGKGIADNFYVLQVAVVNSGQKKVMVPLSGIQAEVEWARGSKEKSGKDNQGNKERDHDTAIATNTNIGLDPASDTDPNFAAKNGNRADDEDDETGENDDNAENVHTSYLEGPPTVSPARLAAVSAHFDAYQKTKGVRAKVFNVLDGLTTFGAALVPFTGPSLQDSHTVVTGGFIPGLHKAIGDLSSQQLQNLTALSWQDTEPIAPGGGSIEKLIFIQRSAQFSSQGITVYGTSKKVEKQITSLFDLDIIGYEVNESTGAQATSTSSSQSKPAAAAAAGTQ